jgi:hypothetical protein
MPALGIDCVLTNDHNPPDFRGELPDIVAGWDATPVTAVWGTRVEDVRMNSLSALPNPVLAGSRLTVGFELALPAWVRLTVHDAGGRLIAPAEDSRLAPSRHEREIDLSGRAPGVCFLRLQIGGTVFTRTITLID